MVRLMPTFQKGFASIIAIGAVILVSAVIGGFFFAQKGKSTINIPGITQVVPKATEKDFSFIEDEKVRKHFVAQANAGTYRQKTASSVKKGSTVNEYQFKGNKLSLRTIENSDKGEVSHLIDINQDDDETIYVKDYSDNKWWKEVIKRSEPSPISEKEPENVVEQYQQKIDLKPIYKFLGMEACGNLNCFKYQEAFSGQQPEISRIFWFDDGKYLLRKQAIETQGIKVTDEYEYEGINIAAPSPTKDVPDGKSAYDYLQPAPPSTPEELNQLQNQLNQYSESGYSSDSQNENYGENNQEYNEASYSEE